MPGRRRSQTERAKHQAQILDLYFQQGLKEQEIADRLGINQSTVSRDLAALRDEWRARIASQRDQVLAELLMENELAKQEYWQAWTRSQQPKETSRTEVSAGGESGDVGGERIKTQTGEEQRDGDPRYMQGVERCLDRIADLLGLKVIKMAHTDPTGNVPADARQQQLSTSDAQKAALIAGILRRAVSRETIAEGREGDHARDG